MKPYLNFKSLILAGFIGFSAAAPAQRVTRDFNSDWTFRAPGEVDRGKTTRVQLPHTWNAQDALSGDIHYLRGTGNYTKTFVAPKEWEGRRIFVRFRGANSVAHVYLNNQLLAEHRGGYSAFAVELTDGLRLGEKNTLHVSVNNGENADVMPLVGDFNFYGGLYREVELLITDRACITPLYHGSPGVFLTTRSVSGRQAEVGLKVVLTNMADERRDATLRWTVRGEGRTVAAGEKAVTLPRFLKEWPVGGGFTIEKPRLWDGRRDPFLYEVEVELLADGRSIDRVVQPLGLRTVSVDPDKGFFLNGRHLTLQGVCRHQERAQLGSALRPEHHREDVDIMLEMGVNAMRLAHYQQADEMYSLADRHGLLVWAEIPFVGPGGYAGTGFTAGPAFRRNAEEQLKELICQQYNHPSIFAWGLFNELNKTLGDPLPLVEWLNHVAHSTDSTRLTTAASNQGGDLNYVTDLIAWNRYDGWYGASPASLGKWLDATHAERPGLRIAISEYGAGASVLHQQDSLKQPAANSWWHPENWQTYYHIETWRIIRQRPFVWGSFVWNMFDFGAAHRTEGDRPGINDKGLVTHDRRTRKDAFYFYKANWNAEPMLHIAGKRARNRKHADTELMVFTNMPEVELLCDGRPVDRQRPDSLHVCRFPVALHPGENRLEVRTTKGKKRLSDQCVWVLE